MAAISSTVPRRIVVPSVSNSSVKPSSVRPTGASSDSSNPGVENGPGANALMVTPRRIR
jgi:hypothetical protein